MQIDETVLRKIIREELQANLGIFKTQELLTLTALSQRLKQDRVTIRKKLVALKIYRAGGKYPQDTITAIEQYDQRPRKTYRSFITKRAKRK